MTLLLAEVCRTSTKIRVSCKVMYHPPFHFSPTFILTGQGIFAEAPPRGSKLTYTPRQPAVQLGRQVRIISHFIHIYKYVCIYVHNTVHCYLKLVAFKCAIGRNPEPSPTWCPQSGWIVIFSASPIWIHLQPSKPPPLLPGALA